MQKLEELTDEERTASQHERSELFRNAIFYLMAHGGYTDKDPRDIEIAKLKKQLEDMEDATTLYYTGRTRNEAIALCGPVMRHKTTEAEWPEIGVVDCHLAYAAVESLIVQRNTLLRQVAMTSAPKGEE